MNNPIRILHLEDSRVDAEVVRGLLSHSDVPHQIRQVSSGPDFQQALQRETFDVVLCDFQIPGFGGRQALEMVRQSHPELPFIFVSGTIGEEAAIGILKQGATDYVLKNRLGRLVPALKRAITEAADRAAKREAETQLLEKVTLLDLTRDAAIVHNDAGCVRFWNKGAEKLFGWSACDMLGQLVPQRLVQKEQLHAWEQVVATTADEGHWHGELKMVSKDNHPLIVDARITAITGPSGISMLFLATDITEKKLLEKQFLRAQRMEPIGILASGIAHDLNNVLTPILLASQMLFERVTDPESRKMVATIQSGALRGADIIRHILTFARGTEAERLVVNPEQLAQEILKFLRRTFPHSIRIETQWPGDSWPVLADPTQIHQVLLNLCVNARDAMLPEGGTLKFELANLEIDQPQTATAGAIKPGRYVRFRVADTGCGMSAEVLAKIFDPFFTTKGPGQGTGLGLSTTVGIVKNHHGGIDVSSQPGKGSVFDIYLPVTAAAPSIAHAAPARIPHGAGELVLVVDDDPAICELTETILRLHGYRALTATNGHEAETIYREKHDEIAVIVTDCSMPGMTGLELVRTIRSHNPQTRFILASGAEPCLEKNLGDPVAFLHKPWTAVEFLSLLRDVLKKPEASP